MKQYYYADNDQQLGPFTIEELKNKRLKKSTLVWSEGMQDWAIAESINELKGILISEPPPLPKENLTSEPPPLSEEILITEPLPLSEEINEPQTIETIHIKQAPNPKKSEKFDLTYEKETVATFVGILLIILKLTGVTIFETIESYNRGGAIIAIISLILRIAITDWVVHIARRQNRNSTGWGWFAFFFPSIALIIIGMLKKLRLKIELDESLTINEKIIILFEKADQLFSSARYTECIEVLNKFIDIDKDNLYCIRLRGLANYHLKNLDIAKDDFETLVNNESFLSEAYYYLGNIEIQKHNREKAVTFWLKVMEQRKDEAQVMLDLYNNFTGKYLLDKSKIIKKLTSNDDIYFAECKYIGGFDEIDLSEKSSKFRAELKGYENGLAIELIKMFKSYHLAIAFYEIDDIIYNELDRKLKLLLVDKKILQFEYNQSKNEYNKGLEQFCIRFKEKTGKNPKALSYWKD